MNRLEEICAAADERFHSQKPEMANVFRIAGRPEFVCATDGHIFAALVDESGANLPEISADKFGKLLELLFGPVPEISATLDRDSLLDWTPADHIGCERCHGRGSGDGKLECGEPSYAVLLDAVINRHLLRRLLLSMPSEEYVTIARKEWQHRPEGSSRFDAATYTLVLRTKGWCGLLMPMRVAPEGLPHFPASPVTGGRWTRESVSPESAAQKKVRQS